VLVLCYDTLKQLVLIFAAVCWPPRWYLPDGRTARTFHHQPTLTRCPERKPRSILRQVLLTAYSFSRAVWKRWPTGQIGRFCPCPCLAFRSGSRASSPVSHGPRPKSNGSHTLSLRRRPHVMCWMQSVGGRKCAGSSRALRCSSRSAFSACCATKCKASSRRLPCRSGCETRPNSPRSWQVRARARTGRRATPRCCAMWRTGLTPFRWSLTHPAITRPPNMPR